MFGLVAAGHARRPSPFLNDQADPASDDLVAALTAYQATLRAHEGRLAAQSSSTSATAQWAIVLFTLAAVATAADARDDADPPDRPARPPDAACRPHGIAVGELDHDVATDSTDEIGDTARAFEGMMAYLQGLADSATRVAQGDLTADVEAKSDRDVLGTAVAGTVEPLRGVTPRFGAAAHHRLRGAERDRERD